jgi:hypothetical protein
MIRPTTDNLAGGDQCEQPATTDPPAGNAPAAPAALDLAPTRTALRFEGAEYSSREC